MEHNIRHNLRNFDFEMIDRCVSQEQDLIRVTFLFPCQCYGEQPVLLQICFEFQSLYNFDFHNHIDLSFNSYFQHINSRKRPNEDSLIIEFRYCQQVFLAQDLMQF
jgi:hypothetical protein